MIPKQCEGKKIPRCKPYTMLNYITVTIQTLCLHGTKPAKFKVSCMINGFRLQWTLTEIHFNESVYGRRQQWATLLQRNTHAYNKMHMIKVIYCIACSNIQDWKWPECQLPVNGTFGTCVLVVRAELHWMQTTSLKH